MADTEMETVTATLCFRDGGGPMVLRVEVPAAAAQPREIADLVLRAAKAADPERLALDERAGPPPA